MTPTVRPERILVVAALVTAGLALEVAVSRALLSGAGAAQVALAWLLVPAIAVVGAAGAAWAGRPHAPVPRVRPGREAGGMIPTGRLLVLRLPLDVVVPALLAAGFALFVQIFESGLVQGLMVVVAGFVFAGVLWAQAHARYIADPRFALAQTALNVIGHLTAFLLFSVIYGLKLRSLISAPAVDVISALLLFELLSRDAAWHRAMGLPVEPQRATAGWMALGGGLVAGELAWGLNYWAALSTLVGGAFLLVVFYVLHGVASNYLDRSLTRRLIVEYGAVGAIAVLVVLASAFVS
jgi:hypothetical protein